VPEGSSVTDALTAFAALLQRSPTNAAVAAAVTVVANATTPPRPAMAGLDAALRAVAPRLSPADHAAWAAALMEPLRKAGMTSPRCVAAFLGQCAHESDGFQDLEENLHYSAARLCQVWPARFPTAEAASACAMQPEILANRVYADRMGNGSAASGDGWRFRGRGLIQLTGRSAYAGFAHTLGMTLDQAVTFAGTKAGAVASAIWFWTTNDLNALAGDWSIDLITRKV
jgi:putative chitinase